MKTDSQLQHDVSAELQWEPAVHATRIGVEVKDGVVTLAGQVDSYGEKWSAEQAALRVSGVKAIAIGLKVHVSSPRQRTDADIAQAVRNALDWTSTLPADAIAVIVEGGLVTLSGSVGWQYQRLAASNSVRHLMGVTGVSNQITITPLEITVESALIKSDIEAALKRTSIADANNIAVAVKGSVVTLSGIIHNWDERDTATYAAWGNPGVYNVVDHMTMAY
jgi:osmotically-inducible protein OsmY